MPKIIHEAFYTKHFNDCSLNTRAAEAKIKGKVNAGAYHRAEIHRFRPRFTAV
jgi:hypothetical protein